MARNSFRIPRQTRSGDDSVAMAKHRRCDHAARCSASREGTTNRHQNGRCCYCLKSNTRWQCNSTEETTTRVGLRGWPERFEWTRCISSKRHKTANSSDHRPSKERNREWTRESFGCRGECVKSRMAGVLRPQSARSVQVCLNVNIYI